MGCNIAKRMKRNQTTSPRVKLSGRVSSLLGVQSIDKISLSAVVYHLASTDWLTSVN